MNSMEKNICMYCGKKSKNDMKYRVSKATTILSKITDYRDFCSTRCLLDYYKIVFNRECD
jgi:endogenous inhibitor of DNA gyrase (YacG/DUF329 family)